jgi:hypothetical protein
MSARHYLAFVAVAVLSAGTADAQFPGDELVCPAPVAVCGPGHGECPDGTECVCVSSCPACDDCAAFVCIDRKAECDSACDCPGTLGCFDGQCIAGFAPVYCCDHGECPSGQQCEFENGEISRCDFSTCDTRRRLLRATIDQMVANHSACRTDEQCVWAPARSDCDSARCGVYVRRSFSDRFDRRFQRLNRRLCADYIADGCIRRDSECGGKQPVCDNGRCSGS